MVETMNKNIVDSIWALGSSEKKTQYTRGSTRVQVGMFNCTRCAWRYADVADILMPECLQTEIIPKPWVSRGCIAAESGVWNRTRVGIYHRVDPVSHSRSISIVESLCQVIRTQPVTVHSFISPEKKNAPETLVPQVHYEMLQQHQISFFTLFQDLKTNLELFKKIM